MEENRKQNYQLLSAKMVAEMLATSVRSVWRYRSAGRLPAPVKVGGAIRWRQADIEKWVSMGCPDRKEFEMFAEMAEGGKK